MSHDWKELKLGEILEVKYGKDHKNLLTGTIPVYGSGGIMRHVNTYMYDDESILIPRKGTLSNIFYRSEPFWTVDTMFWTKINKSKVVPKFLYYQLRTIDFTILNVGSAVPSLTVPVINDIDILLPSLPEQESIAEVLSSLDDKIDLLHQQNKTLEALAETLFRQWFVAEADDSWEQGKLGDFVSISYGKNLPTKNLLTEGYPVFGANGLIGFYSSYIYDQPQVLVSCRGEASGKVNFSSEKSYVTNNSLVLERTKNSKVTFEYLKYFSLKTDYKKYVTGSAQPQITIESLKEADFILPEKNKVVQFSEFVADIEQKIKHNNQQISSLSLIRDTLLPKLMSGAVRVN